ncbi:lysozyme inhibitor LprI family protein [Limibacter armeniacum]|uniref:lysozyme inhibitor LprI family protein n=1 Tax=Limibacter armeniacum TaxID=466084 RepID=UPI002FE58429
MKPNTLLLTLSIVLYTFTAFGQTYPIDTMIMKCKQENSSNLGVLECDMKGFELWTTEMEKNYDLLFKQMDREGQRMLQEQQTLWRKMMEAQLEFNHYYYKNKGTSGMLIISSEKTQIVRKRALELRGHLERLVLK